MTQKLKLSYSQCTQLIRCKKRWWFQYIEDLTPKLKSFPLKVGDITGRVLRNGRDLRRERRTHGTQLRDASRGSLTAAIGNADHRSDTVGLHPDGNRYRPAHAGVLLHVPRRRRGQHRSTPERRRSPAGSGDHQVQGRFRWTIEARRCWHAPTG